jgi:hypothetical protein
MLSHQRIVFWGKLFAQQLSEVALSEIIPIGET